MSWKKLFCNYLIYQEHLAMELKDPKESAKGKDFHTHKKPIQFTNGQWT